MIGPKRALRPAWIAFDAVGTLIYPDPPVTTAYHRIASKYGSRLSETEIAQRFRFVFDQLERDETGRAADWADPEELTTSERQEQDRWRTIVASVIDDVEATESCFQDLFRYFAQPAAWSSYADVADTLKALHSEGFRLAVATNFDGRFEGIWRGLPALQPLELGVISSRAGYRKPSVHFFRHLCDAAECAPHEMLLVGDDEQNDIRGGQLAGLQVMRLRRDARHDMSAKDAAVLEIASLRELMDRFEN